MPTDTWTPTVLSLLLVPVLLVAYLLPTMVGFRRHVRRRGLLFALNLFCGWTVITWVLCFIWACWMPREADPMSWQSIWDHSAPRPR